MLQQTIDEEVSLRMFNEGDSEEFYSLTVRSKEYLRQWLGWVDRIVSPEDTAHHINAKLMAFAQNGGYPMSFAIIYKGVIAGTIGFNTISRSNKTGVIGYWLGEEFQGKRIMSRSFGAMLEYGFKEIGLNRIEVCAAAENHKSRAIPERFGFQKEGTLRQAEWLYDHYVDLVMYSLLAEEWINKSCK